MRGLLTRDDGSAGLPRIVCARAIRANSSLLSGGVKPGRAGQQSVRSPSPFSIQSRREDGRRRQPPRRARRGDGPLSAAPHATHGQTGQRSSARGSTRRALRRAPARSAASGGRISGPCARFHGVRPLRRSAVRPAPLLRCLLVVPPARSSPARRMARPPQLPANEKDPP